MDGDNFMENPIKHGIISKPYEQMGWFGGFSHYFWLNDSTPHICNGKYHQTLADVPASKVSFSGV